MNIINSFNKIKQEIKNEKPDQDVEIIAVSKTFSLEHIMPLINYGHKHFGENKVQEAEKKWLDIKKRKSEIKLHMIGSLQSNKVKKAIEIFEFIHSLDSEKLANEISKREIEKNKKLKHFIQVNLGSEEQKGGIEIQELKNFYEYCTKKLNLNILGLMAIPPNDGETKKYFKKISELNSSLGLTKLSIGMSNDYIEALRFGSSHIRIGTSIFGKRS